MIQMELERLHNALEDGRIRQEEQAAVIIQRFYRAQRYLRQQKLEQAAVLLQSHIRKFLAMKRYERLRANGNNYCDVKETEEEKAAAQFLINCINDANHLAVDESLLRIRRQSEERAATKIQRFYRNQRDQKIEKAATVLQSYIRRFLAMRRYDRLRNGPLEEMIIPPSTHAPELEFRLQNPQEEVAARKIQRFYRKHRNDMEQKVNKAAVVIQSHIRRYLAMRRVEQIRKSRRLIGQNLILDPELLSPELAATKIQSVWRGFSARRKLSGGPQPLFNSTNTL